MNFDELDRQMRVYEESLDQVLLPELYLVARLDGNRFTRLTKEVCNFEAPFDERFRRYGYEDVLFGKRLKQGGISITHIENPLGFNTFEPNQQFLRKTEEALTTLHDFRDDLRGYSQMLTLAEGIHVGLVRWLIRLWHRLIGPMERRNLCGRHPNLTVFKLYKIGYYLSIKN